MNKYKVLTMQTYEYKNFSIVPIRIEDRYTIMNWRNEQMYHLRQNEVLTKEKQDAYFDTVIAQLFEQDQPEQILFSYLEGEKCIGYGGLVHINWKDKNAEISFLCDTKIENQSFEYHWTNFLALLEKLAWAELNLHKIYTFAFDLRPALYPALEKAGFAEDAVLKEHSYFSGKFIDVKIHSKFNKKPELREAELSDFYLTHKWANTPSVRAFSFNKDEISLKEHLSWYFSKLESSNCEYYILEVNGNSAGSIRFDIEKHQIVKINYLLDPNYTGKGFGTFLLKKGLKFLKENKPFIQKVYGFVLKENFASIRIFEKLSFIKVTESETELKFEKSLYENRK
ncbi:GNAT family protein [Salinimicrobium sp. 3283s]|uniref:GNAT family N-acetyltransferase n=1 Tax=Salinimicrobium sp. 3283s TaxID=3114359 RepID=UPI0031E96204